MLNTDKHKQSEQDNLTSIEPRELTPNPHIVIHKADKPSTIVVKDIDDDISNVMSHLNDS